LTKIEDNQSRRFYSSSKEESHKPALTFLQKDLQWILSRDKTEMECDRA
jgi:hypothetical protein